MWTKYEIGNLASEPQILKTALRELSLAINTPEGMVTIVGCSHPGIDKIVEEASTINPRIHMVAGGFHLVVGKLAEHAATSSHTRDTARHQSSRELCTGVRAIFVYFCSSTKMACDTQSPW